MLQHNNLHPMKTKTHFIILSIILITNRLYSQTAIVQNIPIYIQSDLNVYVNGGVDLRTNAVLNNHGNLHITNGDLYIKNTATSKGTGNYTIGGNWINDGIFQENTSTVTLTSDAIQQIKSNNGTITNFYNLNLQGTGNAIKKIENTIVIKKKLDITDREVQTGSNRIKITNAQNTALASNNAGFVASTYNGGIEWTMVSGEYTYPIGSSVGIKRYRPLVFTSYGNNVTLARFINNAASSDGYPTSSFDASICSVNNDFYHSIYRLSSSGACDIGVVYDGILENNWSGLAQWGTPGANQWNSLGTTTNQVYADNYRVLKNTNVQESLIQLALDRPRTVQSVIDGPEAVCNQHTSIYTVSPSNPTSTYNWTVPTGATVITGQGTDRLELFWDNVTPSTLQVTESNADANYCTALPAEKVIAIDLLSNCTTGLNTTTTNEVSIYPVPVNDVLTIQATTSINNIRLYDELGKIIQQKTLNATNAVIDVSDIAQGIYYLHLEMPNHTIITKKIVKQ